MIHESDKFNTVFEDFRKSARDFFSVEISYLFSAKLATFVSCLLKPPSG